MHKRLRKCLDAYEILYPIQFRFREKHSTVHALFSLTESIKFPIDREKFGSGIFLDLQKPLIWLTIRFYLINSNIIV